MKEILNNKLIVSGLFLIGIFSACTSESPFSSNSGEGKLRLDISVNHKITRAEISDEEEQKLLDNCVIYISDDNGLLHKWQGYSNLPSEITLKYGTYLAEAWSGDSVTASLDSKFYKGQKSFTLNDKNQIATVAIECRIANVIGSVDQETIESSMKDLKVTFGNTHGSVSMEGDDLFGKAYLMMPDNDNILKYSVSCMGPDGNPIDMDGEVPEVKQGHEYRLKFKTDKTPSTTGGAFFSIEIVEFEQEEEKEIVIYGKPDFSWDGNDPKEGGQIVGTPGSFTSKILRIGAYKGFSSLKINTGDMKSKLGNVDSYEIIGHENLQQLTNFGITVEESSQEREDGLYIWYLTFTDKFLNSLDPKDTEYVMTISATDKTQSQKNNSMDVRVANTDAAIIYEDPAVVPNTNFFDSDYMALGATSVTIPITIIDNSQFLGLQYKKENESEDKWQLQTIINSRDQNTSVTLTNLDPGTTYQYRIVSGEETAGSYKFTSKIQTFKTESKFEIPNASMENWCTSSNIVEPSASNSLHSFWDTGNHGSVKANVTLTQSSTEIVGSGSYSARLRSQKATIFGLGKFAAGNLFAGTYKETSGTNGIIDFGQSYNGSHPKSLKVKVHYRPGKVEENVSGQSYLNKGDTDQGQIYIALTTEPIQVNTGNKSTLFDVQKETDKVIAYGEKTFTEDFGPDNEMSDLIINFDYKDIAKTIRPKYLVIVCSASKFGDYFVGGEGSVMYVDDFELVY